MIKMAAGWKRQGYLFIVLVLIVYIGCGTIIPLSLPEKDIEANEDWLTLGGNGQHTHHSMHNVVPPLEVVWRARVKSVITDHPLAMANRILALTKSGMFYQVDYETGKTLGDGNFGPAIEHVPTIEGNILYTGFSLGDQTLIGFDLQRAKTKLKRHYPHINTTPLFWEGKLFFGTVSGSFFCINANSGEQIWKYDAEAPIQSSPAMQDQYIIFADDKGNLYALDSTSGIEIWKTPLEGNTFSHPVIDNSVIFIGTLSGNLYAVQAKNGKIRWEQHFSGSIYSSPSVYGDFIYIGNNNHNVIALRKNSGEIIWEYSTDGIVNTVPLPSPDYLYIASWDKHLYVLNRLNGKLLFKMNFDDPLKSSPIIYKDVLFVQTANGHLYALGNEKYILSRREKR